MYFLNYSYNTKKQFLLFLGRLYNMKEVQESTTVSHRNLYLSVFISEYIIFWILNSNLFATSHRYKKTNLLFCLIQLLFS